MALGQRTWYDLSSQQIREPVHSQAHNNPSPGSTTHPSSLTARFLR